MNSACVIEVNALPMPPANRPCRKNLVRARAARVPAVINATTADSAVSQPA